MQPLNVGSKHTNLLYRLALVQEAAQCSEHGPWRLVRPAKQRLAAVHGLDKHDYLAGQGQHVKWHDEARDLWQPKTAPCSWHAFKAMTGDPQALYLESRF